MAQYTKNYKIPYPTEGDPIHEGAGQMQRLAETVDKTMTTVNGKQGPPGKDGRDGAPGRQGEPGPPGRDGKDGQDGAPGKQGDPGTGLRLLGTKPTVNDLPTTAQPGDAYLIEETTDVYVWSGTQWSNVGQIRGAKGEPGTPGRDGRDGKDGAPGPAGKDGAPGTPGRDGKDGTNGKDGAPGTPGQETPPPRWETTGLTLKDSGRINLGSGGSFIYRWRVDRGIFHCYFRITWGRNASSGGGDVSIDIPRAPLNGLEGIGTGHYYSSGGGFGMVVTPIVSPNTRTLSLWVHRSGADTTQSRFRIWDGRNGNQTGIPFNPGYTLDREGSRLAGYIEFPV